MLLNFLDFHLKLLVIISDLKMLWMISRIATLPLVLKGGDDEEKKQESDTLPSFQRLGIGLPDLKCKKKGLAKGFQGNLILQKLLIN
ncbi:hypothetical protein J1N35_009044 [Gossypium stocksii]|uniref:Uncharacterized protein n=1 Tax=Gossypium stocksii TaxID=47602 RepID=A0A9D4AHA4_9ROSI|nr:hypothetical protein J1N35_009044 [Gossypium stocksii]